MKTLPNQTENQDINFAPQSEFDPNATVKMNRKLEHPVKYVYYVGESVSLPIATKNFGNIYLDFKVVAIEGDKYLLLGQGKLVIGAFDNNEFVYTSAHDIHEIPVSDFSNRPL